MQPNAGRGRGLGAMPMTMYPQMGMPWPQMTAEGMIPMPFPQQEVGGPICRFFARGSCKNGPGCRFRHVVNQGGPVMGPMPTMPISPTGPTRSQPPCRFFAVGACREGEACRFSHDPTPEGLERPICRFNLAGNCRFGDKCVDRHPEDTYQSKRGRICGLCEKKDKQFGLLLGCDHSFCLDCIVGYKAKGTILSCPICHSPSLFVIPSDEFAVGDSKTEIITGYLAKLATLPCKHFEKTGDCPFGKCCFFNHLKDGEVVDKTEQPEPLFERIRSIQDSSALIKQLPMLLKLVEGGNDVFSLFSVPAETAGDAVDRDVVMDMIDQFGTLEISP